MKATEDRIEEYLSIPVKVGPKDYLNDNYIRIGNLAVGDVEAGVPARTRKDFNSDEDYRIYIFVLHETAVDAKAGRPLLRGYVNE